MARWVLHVDLDQFIAAVEILRRPELAGLPVVVGGRGDPTERAVVSTASYEARAFGVHSGMPLKLAVRKIPDAVFLPVDAPAYDSASAVVMEALRAHPGAVVQVLGWDEAFVGIETPDRTWARRWPTPTPSAPRCSRRRRCTARSASVTRPCAPRSRPTSASRRARSSSPARTGSRSWGSGRRRRCGESATGSPRRLATHGYETVQQLADASDEVLTAEFGPRMGPHYGRLGRGLGATVIDDTPWVARAHGRETTYQANLVEPGEIDTALRTLSEQVIEDIRREGRACARVHLKVRFAPFFTTTRIRKLPEPTFDPEVVAATAIDLLRGLGDDRPIRLLGVRAEMVPPEGGYEQPRTTGRGGPAAAPP